MITIRVNGEERQIAEGSTVEDLLVLLAVRRDRLAVERNRTIVPRTTFAQTELVDADQIEIVSLVGGG